MTRGRKKKDELGRASDLTRRHVWITTHVASALICMTRQGGAFGIQGPQLNAYAVVPGAG
jgi:hypothetical protein